MKVRVKSKPWASGGSWGRRDVERCRQERQPTLAVACHR